MLTGPPLAGIVMTGVTGGRTALKDYRNRLLRWRVSSRWYFTAILIAPAAVIISDLAIRSVWMDATPLLFTSGGSGPIQASSRPAFVAIGIAVGVGAGFFEELGWTGFATPALRTRYGVLGTGLGLGIMWGAWHFLAVLWGSVSAFGEIPIPLFMFVALFSFLPPYRLLMTKVYERTGSLAIGILMHASLTTSMLLLGPQVVGAASVANNIVFATVLWLVALVFVRRAQATATTAARHAAASRSALNTTSSSTTRDAASRVTP